MPISAMRVSPRRATSSSSARTGEKPIFMPRVSRMAAGSRTSTGRGRQRSSGAAAVASTASTAPVSSRRSPRRVAIPVHCAPASAGRRRARYIAR
ncbi:MAG TPA: hypothetical protein VG692_07485 [Gemmatimonadales bacterium]|nr:hypothetical protein [Gemmatimonadales bacterium]